MSQKESTRPNKNKKTHGDLGHRGEPPEGKSKISSSENLLKRQLGTRIAVEEQLRIGPVEIALLVEVTHVPALLIDVTDPATVSESVPHGRSDSLAEKPSATHPSRFLKRMAGSADAA